MTDRVLSTIVLRDPVLHHAWPWLLRDRVASPWAVILVKFADDPDRDPDRAIYEKLFTSAGAGTDNMLEFFSDMSHGKLDLSGSRVFGWYRLSQNRSDYLGNVGTVPAGKLNRGLLVQAARDAATAHGVDLTAFSGVCVSAYGATDLCGWVGGMTALCDQHSLEPSLLGQEMGHGYGLDHARRDGSTDDYQDPFDVMSTAAWPGDEAADPNYTHVGPGLNAHNMRSRGWLDESRVWTAAPSTFGATVTLRPLHHHWLPGTLAAEVGPYLVELRVPEKWDAAIGDAAVLVHRFDDNHSYLMAGTAGQTALTAGGLFETGSPSWPFAPYLAVEVVSIDAHAHRAEVRLTRRPARREPVVGPVTSYGGVEVDGGGFVVLPGGAVKPVPPRGPITELVRLAAEYAAHDLGTDVALGLATRRSMLGAISAIADALQEENDLVSSSPPAYTARIAELRRKEAAGRG